MSAPRASRADQAGPIPPNPVESPSENSSDSVSVAQTQPREAATGQSDRESLTESTSLNSDEKGIKAESAATLWMSAMDRLGGLDAELGRQYLQVAVDGQKLTVRFDGPLSIDRFRQDERAASLLRILRELSGIDLDLRFEQHEEPETAKPVNRKKAEWALRQETVRHPLVQQAIELFDADVTQVQSPPRSSPAASRPSTVPSS